MHAARLLLSMFVCLASAAPALADVRVIADLAYGPNPAQRFDVYVPKGARAAPLLLFVHGGAWKFGDKRHGAVVENKAAYWTGRGFIVVSINYRMLPQADPLVQAADVASALAAAQVRAPEWGGAAGKTIVMGHSAGAHLVALLAASGRLPGTLGVVALDTAVFDVELLMQGSPLRLHKAAFGSDPALWRAASPYAQLQQAGVALLAVCSTQRDDSCPQAQRYAAKVRALGGSAEVLPQDLSHRAINQTLGEAGPYTDAVTRFIASLPGLR